MDHLPKRATAREAVDLLGKSVAILGSEEIAIVRNPSYIYAPFELYPLPPRPREPLRRIAGIVKDMDGTTTTTEPLCLHSLEWMVRQVTGRTTPELWPGLDPHEDYPHVIGNSTTKHVEYLIATYADAFQPMECLKAWIRCAGWTLAHGRDRKRQQEVLGNVTALGLHALLKEPVFAKLADGQVFPDADKRVDELAEKESKQLLEAFRVQRLPDRVRASIDIYYARYHQILGDIQDGQGQNRAAKVLGSPDAHLIEPMPGIGIFLAAVKGWLGKDLGLFTEILADHVQARNPEVVTNSTDVMRTRLQTLGRYLSHHPAPVAVVTSSIAYEANIVLGEVFSILRKEISDWPVSAEKRESLFSHFGSPQRLYDAFITATDSSEIRLKPHRDLYSIALHTMGLSHEDFPQVIGFEDSESGVVAIRAAGVAWSIAVPFADTTGHDLSAAVRILPGQIPEALAIHALFLDPWILEERG